MDETREILTQMNNVMHVDDGYGLMDALRLMGSGLVAFLVWINNYIEDIVGKILTLNGFYSSDPVQQFMATVRPIAWALFGIAVVVLGFQFILNKIEKRHEVLMNVLLALCFIVVLPDLMVNLGNITSSGIGAIQPDTSSLSTSLIKTNVLDVKYYAEQDFSFSANKNGNENSPPRPKQKGSTATDAGTDDFTYANQLSSTSIPYLDYTEKITKDDIKAYSDVTKEVLTHKLVADGNTLSFEELRSNTVPFTSIGEENYYRYHVNWTTLIFSLLVTTVALVITVVKIGRVAFDLGFHQIFGTFVAVTDLTGGQRTKKILAEIINSFAVLFVMVLILRLFVFYTTWVTGLKGSIGMVGVVLLLLAGAWAVIDAPDIIQRLLGIDAGLRSSWGTLAGAYAATKLGSSIAKPLGKGVAAAAGGASSSVSFGWGTVRGMMNAKPGQGLRIPLKKWLGGSPSGAGGASGNQDTGGSASNGGGATGNQGQGTGSPPTGVKRVPGNQATGVPTSEVRGASGSYGTGGSPSGDGGTAGSHGTGGSSSGVGGTTRNQGIGASTSEIGGTKEKGTGTSTSRARRSAAGNPIGNSSSAKKGSSGVQQIENPKGDSSEKQPISTERQQTRNSSSGNANPSENKASNGYEMMDGFKEAKHYNTTGGRMLRNQKEAWVQAGNSGYRLGKNVRKAALTINKKAIQPILRDFKKPEIKSLEEVENGRENSDEK